MSTNSNRLITVFGGSGFLGRHVVRALARRDFRIRVAVRRPDLAFHLQPLGRVGQITAVQANLRYPDSVVAAMRGADTAINLVGILAEHGRQRFTTVQAEGADAVARAARDAGAAMIHVSAIGADADSPSYYAQSKAAGEAAVRDARPDAVIMRPSVVFGPEDDFINRFARLAQLSPVMPLVGGGATRMQPVFVGDVATAIAQAVEGTVAPGTYELGGPRIMTLREIIDYILATIERERILVPLPFFAAHLKSYALQYAWAPFTLTPDQVTLLKSDNIVSEQALRDRRTFEGLGLMPTTLEAIAPSYLWPYRRTGQFRKTPA